MIAAVIFQTTTTCAHLLDLSETCFVYSFAASCHCMAFLLSRSRGAWSVMASSIGFNLKGDAIGGGFLKETFCFSEVRFQERTPDLDVFLNVLATEQEHHHQRILAMITACQVRVGTVTSRASRMSCFVTGALDLSPTP